MAGKSTLVGPDTIDGVRVGEKEASRQLFQFIYERVAMILGRDSHDVQDAAMDAFKKVVDAILDGAFDPERGDKAASWVSTIAIRTAFDQARRTARRSSYVELREELPDVADPEWSDPGQEIDRHRQSQLIDEHLSRLDEDDRAILILRYWDDLSQEQIAAAFEIPVGTVKSRLHRIEARLRRAMKLVPPGDVAQVAASGVGSK